MKGGSAMLIATIMSAFASTPVAEAQMLVTKPSTVCEANNTDKIAHALTCLDNRKQELTRILTNFRKYYYDICNNENLVDLSEYENLKSLDLYSRGMSEFMKGILTKEATHIKSEYGEEVFQAFRHLVATHGQVRKNISNIIAVYEDKNGMVETLHNTDSTPTKEFITAAFQVSDKIYNTH
jgi:hypothetical protein